MDDSRQEAGDSTLTLARAAAEAVRGLNHATSGGLGQPALPNRGGRGEKALIPRRVRARGLR